MALKKFPPLPLVPQTYDPAPFRQLNTILSQINYEGDSFFNERETIFQTLDDTPLDTGLIGVQENSALTVELFVTATKADYSASLSAVLWAGFRRASGNVTLVGTVQGTAQEDGGAIAVTLVANTTDQTIDIRTTGEAATTYYWSVVYKWRVL